MKTPPTFLTLSTLAFALGLNSGAKASQDVALSFDLQPLNTHDTTDASVDRVATAPTAPSAFSPTQLDEQNAPLPVPATATNPPVSGTMSRPEGTYGGGQALAVGDRNGQMSPYLPAPPPNLSSAIVVPDVQADFSKAESPRAASPQPSPEEAIDTLLLGFDLENSSATTANLTALAKPKAHNAEPVQQAVNVVAHLFNGGTESLVARAVGSAEGTRTPEGHKTPAYFGHTDPGNHAWNLGTFSYQHSASTPEEADAKQLNRLRSQTQFLKQKAQARGLQLSTEELLNGIDLANQAPMAALERSGYVDWLAEAHRLNMTGSEAIIWARTRSFLDPDTQRWNAPGLGNNIHSITHDQARRADAIARAMKAEPSSLPDSETNSPAENASAMEPTSLAESQPLDAPMGLMFHLFSQNTSATSSALQSAPLDHEAKPQIIEATSAIAADANTLTPKTRETQPIAPHEPATNAATGVPAAHILPREQDELTLAADTSLSSTPQNSDPPSMTTVIPSIDAKLAEPTSQIFWPTPATASVDSLSGQVSEEHTEEQIQDAALPQ